MVTSQSQDSRVNMVQKHLALASVDLVEEERPSLAKEDEEDEEDREAREDEGPLDSPIKGDFRYSRDFLISGEPFNSLHKDFWKFIVQKSEVVNPSLLTNKLSSKVYVQIALEPWFPSTFHRCYSLKINIYWEVLHYLQKELEEGYSLKALLTLVALAYT